MYYSHKLISPTFKYNKFNQYHLHDLAQYDCFDIVNSSESETVLNNPQLHNWMKFDKFIIFGTGGSSLGGQCIHAVAQPQKDIIFASNLDPHSLELLLHSSDLSQTGFLCISKSGETLETITQTLLAINALKNLENFADHFVIITEDKLSSLQSIAQHYNMLSLPHPKTIGGRFSVFSIVGMLPAILCGFDIKRIYAGAKSVLQNFKQYDDNAVVQGAEFVYAGLEMRKHEHVSFIYSDRLSVLGDWIAQLYAESSGKNGTGVTPLKAIGAVDQHSQLQLYLDGPQNKCFSFLIEKPESQLAVSSDFIPQNFRHLVDKKVSDIFLAQSSAVIQALTEGVHHIRKFEFALTQETLGALFMHFMLEVASVCKMMHIPAFDQPAVERCKIITKEILSGE